MRESTATDDHPPAGFRRPLRLLAILSVLFLAACGGGGCETEAADVSTDDEAESDDGSESGNEDAGTENVVEGGDDGDGSGDDGGDSGDGGDDDDDVSEGTGGDLAFAEGYDDIVDVMFGDLDDATYDGRSQCLVDPLANEQPVDPLGLRPSNRSHLLADGHDIWVVCLIEVEPADGPDQTLGILSLVDPDGRVWGEGSLVIDSENGRAGVRRLGYGQETDLIEPVTVRSGDVLIPVGSTYRLGDYRVTTLYLEVPVQRPDGSWTVTLDGAANRAVQLESPACGTADGPVRNPWPIPPNRRIVSWPELIVWVDAEDQVTVPYVPVDHCLAAPHVLGRDHREAATIMSDAIESLGRTPTMQISTVVCDSSAAGSTVTAQSPVPNDRLGDVYSFTVVTACPTMPDVIGLTLSDARRAVEELVDPGRGITFRIEELGACVDDNSIITATFPQPGGDFFSGSGLQVDLRC